MKTLKSESTMDTLLEQSECTRQTPSAISPHPLGFKVGHILVPIDFSLPCKRSLDCALSMAQQHNAKITLLYVIENASNQGIDDIFSQNAGEYQQLLEEKAQHSLKMLKTAFDPNATLIRESILRTGKPWKEIITAAKDLDVDLVVIATRGYTGLKHAFLGSNTERVVREAPCPVLVIRG
jgi:nucleotide-binding universal stress UspA family protein